MPPPAGASANSTGDPMRLRFVIAIPLLLPVLAGTLAGDVAKTPTLLGKSPFLPPGFTPPGQAAGKPPAPAVQTGQYEFRGVYELNEVYYFNLYNTRERKGKWLNDSGIDHGEPEDADYRIVDFDPESDELVVQMEGQTLNLSLVEPSDKPMPVQTAPAPKVAQPKQQAKPENTRNTRRRVIRPVNRNRTTNTNRPVRRRVIRPVSRQNK